MKYEKNWGVFNKTLVEVRDWLDWILHYKKLKEEWEYEVQDLEGRFIYYRRKTEKELNKYKEKVNSYQEQINKQALIIQKKQNKIKELNLSIRSLKIKLFEKDKS